MRQRFQEAEQATAYRASASQTAMAPQAATATVAARTLTPIRYKPLRSERKERKRVKVGVRQVILGTVLFFVLPWMPADQKLIAQCFPAKAIVPVGSANAVYSEAGQFLQHDWETLHRDLAQTSGRAKRGATRLPQGLQDPYGFTTVDALQALDQRATPVLPLVKKALARPFDASLFYAGKTDIFMTSQRLVEIAIRHGVLAALKGDHTAAVDAYLDACALGTQAHRYSRERAMQSSLGPLKQSISHLTPTKAAATATRLEGLLAKRPTFVTEFTNQQAEWVACAEFRAYPRVLPGVENYALLTRFPILRVLSKYRGSYYHTLSAQQLALLQSPDAQTVAKLEAVAARGGADKEFLQFTAGEFQSYIKNTERAAEVLALLKARAGE
jgi:hypothetical protein